MISVVIPTLNAEQSLPKTLSALIGPTVRGRVKEVIVADAGSADETTAIVEATGAHLVMCKKGRGTQLAAGAAEARGDWILFLHADTALDTGWDEEVAAFIERVENGPAARRDKAAYFRFALDDFSWQARFLESMVSLRCFLFALPYGDQGLLIERRFYERLGGFKDVPLMEDVDLVRRIGRRRLVPLRATAVTSAERYVNDGFFARSLRNLACLTLYYLRVPRKVIHRVYGTS